MAINFTEILTDCTLNDIIAVPILNHAQWIDLNLVENLGSQLIITMLQNALNHTASMQIKAQLIHMWMNMRVQKILESIEFSFIAVVVVI